MRIIAKQWSDVLAVEVSGGILVDVPDQQTRPGEHQGHGGWCVVRRLLLRLTATFEGPRAGFLLMLHYLFWHDFAEY